MRRKTFALRRIPGPLAGLEIAGSAPNPEKHYLAQERERLVQRAIRGFATQHLRSSGDAALARLFGRGNRARDGHLGWRRQASAVSRQEGPAQSSEPEKHRR